MFENLVESTRRRSPRKKLFFFLTTSIVWSLVFAALIIGGIYTYDTKLDDEYKLLTHLPPPPPPPPPPAGRPGPAKPASPKPQQPVKQRLALVAPKETPPVSVRKAPD